MKRNIAVAALFLFLACVVTFPLAFHLTEAVSYGNRSGDHLFFLWNLWWAKKSLVDLGTNPYFTDYLFYPMGKSLYIHSLVLPLGVVSIPFQVLMGDGRGLILAFNLVCLASLVLAGFCTYAYVRKLTGDGRAGIVSGAIFAFSPFTIWHLNNPEFLCIFCFPAAAYLLTRLAETGRARFSVLLSICFALVAYISYSMAFYLIFFLGLAFVCGRFGRRAGSALRSLAYFAGLSLLLLSPVLWPSLREAGMYLQPREDITAFSSNLLAYFVPNSPLTLPGRLGLGSDLGGNGMNGCETFLGYVPLLLCVFAVIRVRFSETRFWLLTAVAGALMSLGPRLHFSRWVVNLPLPYHYLMELLPFVNVYRAPGRFSILATFGVAVLAGYGFSRLRSAAGSRGVLLCSLLVALVMVEFVPFPNLIDPLRYPSVFDALAAEEGDFAVLEIPVGDFYDDSFYMYGQTIHGKRLLSGVTSRLDRSDFAVLRSLPPVVSVAGGEVGVELAERLRALGVRFIVYHGPDPAPVVVRLD